MGSKGNSNKASKYNFYEYSTSEVVSEVGLLTEAEEKGLPCCDVLPSPGVGVGVFRCSSMRLISMGGRTAMPPIGLR